MSLRVLLLTCAAATIAAICASPGRADLVGTPVEVPADVAAVAGAVETAVEPVTAPAPAPAAAAVETTTQQAKQVAAPLTQAISAATTPATATPVTRGISQARQTSATPRKQQRAVSQHRRIDRAATAIRRQKTPHVDGVLLLGRTKALPPVPLAATPSSASEPDRNFPQFPGTPIGASSLDATSAGALFLLLALALFFLAIAALEFGAPLRLAPQLLRPQRYATPLDRPG
jgi:hypothetical protein